MVKWTISKKIDKDIFKQDFRQYMDVWVMVNSFFDSEQDLEYVLELVRVWYEKLEDEEIFETGFHFTPVSLVLVRRTFPSLFANKVVGFQPMTTPVGLAYAMRVIYNDGNNEDAEDNV